MTTDTAAVPDHLRDILALGAGAFARSRCGQKVARLWPHTTEGRWWAAVERPGGVPTLLARPTTAGEARLFFDLLGCDLAGAVWEMVWDEPAAANPFTPGAAP